MKKILPAFSAVVLLAACQPITWEEQADLDLGRVSITDSASFDARVAWEGEANVRRDVTLRVSDIEHRRFELAPPLEVSIVWVSPDGSESEHPIEMDLVEIRGTAIDDGTRGMCEGGVELCELDYGFDIVLSRPLVMGETLELDLVLEARAEGNLGLYDDGPPPYTIDVVEITD